MDAPCARALVCDATSDFTFARTALLSSPRTIRPSSASTATPSTMRSVIFKATVRPPNESKSGGLHASLEAVRFHPRGGEGFRVNIQRENRARARLVFEPIYHSPHTASELSNSPNTINNSRTPRKQVCSVSTRASRRKPDRNLSDALRPVVARQILYDLKQGARLSGFPCPTVIT